MEQAIFGIDLGTTHSLIGYGDELLTDLVSSNVDVEKKRQVGRDVVSENTVSSYKTDMSIGESGRLSVLCSSIILKELAKQGSLKTRKEVQDVVISVPAMFTTSKREAVFKAGELAGLNVKAVINEPTAAALYVCKDLKDLIVVYDLGGGTFDVTIIDSRLGNYSVVATDGDNIGGDDLDLALVEDMMKECRIPLRYRSYLNKQKMKSRIRLAKEEIQQKRSDIIVDFSEFNAEKEYLLTVEKYKKIVKSTFAKTFELTNFILSKGVPVSETPKAVFVGGSSACPYLREMLKEELGLEEIKCNTKPDLIVAKGVAIYAKLLAEGKAAQYIQDVTKRLCVEDENGRGLTIIENNALIPCKNSIIVYNSKADETLSLNLYQGDALFCRDNTYIGKLEFDFGRRVERNEGVVNVTVEVSVDGIISLSAYEVLFGEETKQTIELTAR